MYKFLHKYLMRYQQSNHKILLLNYKGKKLYINRKACLYKSGVTCDV